MNGCLAHGDMGEAGTPPYGADLAKGFRQG